jgi:hypothetical protein
MDSKYLKYIFIAIGGIILVGTAIFFIFFFNSPSTTITPEAPATELIDKTSLVLSANQHFRFDLDNVEYQIIVNSTSESSSFITIQNNNTVFAATFHLNENKSFDLNGNDVNDFIVKLNNITKGKANLYIEKIICLENWECDNWGGCSSINQTRTCEDKNHCGTEKSKPVESQRCYTCIDLHGVICGTGETCNQTASDSLNGKCCLGICAPKEFIACSNINCLITASENCDMANLTYNSTYTVNETSNQIVRYYYKIRGMKDNKCQLYQEILGITNETQSDSILGKSGICRFPEYALPEYLKQVNESKYELSASERTDYECDGTLFS